MVFTSSYRDIDVSMTAGRARLASVVTHMALGNGGHRADTESVVEPTADLTDLRGTIVPTRGLLDRVDVQDTYLVFNKTFWSDSLTEADFPNGLLVVTEMGLYAGTQLVAIQSFYHPSIPGKALVRPFIPGSRMCIVVDWKIGS